MKKRQVAAVAAPRASASGTGNRGSGTGDEAAVQATRGEWRAGERGEKRRNGDAARGERGSGTGECQRHGQQRQRENNFNERTTIMATELNTNVPAGMRLTVAIIGNRNAGKSTLLNRIVGQEVSIVSDEPGTTTDAVAKAYELIPVGPVSFYDTAGLDDEGALGRQRVQAAKKILRRADMALLVIGRDGITREDERLLTKLAEKRIPFVPVFNFSDERQLGKFDRAVMQLYDGVAVSAKTGEGIDALKRRMAEVLEPLAHEPPLVADLIKPKDLVMLVVPIDLAAPKGRLILPQVQVLREVLDAGAMALTVKESEVADMLRALAAKPALVITDSQAVREVAAAVPEDIRLTTFSTLFARYKGDFAAQLAGAAAIDTLKDGDRVLIAEGCSHHVTCDDIGRVKIPNWMKKYTGRELKFEWTQGADFPDNLEDYALVVHCGGCMLNRAEVRRRINECARQGVRVTNYGIVISKMQGVLERVVRGIADADGGSATGSVSDTGNEGD